MKGNVDNSFEVDYRYDYSYDVLAIKVTRPFKYDKTVEMDEGVLLDFDEENIPGCVRFGTDFLIFNV